MQKAFTFYLSAFTLTLLAACSLNPAIQGRGQDYLQGEWKQDSVAMQSQLLRYSLFKFRFSCDSVYMEIASHAKVNSGMDSCMNKGDWKEYVRGTYQQRNDTLRIKGNFCNADFTLKKQAGCFRSGPYDETFVVSNKADSTVQFLSTSNVIPVNLHLVKRIGCVPKPI
jgi:hypothetical protein